MSATATSLTLVPVGPVMIRAPTEKTAASSPLIAGVSAGDGSQEAPRLCCLTAQLIGQNNRLITEFAALPGGCRAQLPYASGDSGRHIGNLFGRFFAQQFHRLRRQFQMISPGKLERLFPECTQKCTQKYAITLSNSFSISTIFSPALLNASIYHLLHCLRASFVQSASINLLLRNNKNSRSPSDKSHDRLSGRSAHRLSGF